MKKTNDIFEVFPDFKTSILTKLKGKPIKSKYLWNDWLGGKLLKKIFVIRKFGFELSLYKEVKVEK